MATKSSLFPVSLFFLEKNEKRVDDESDALQKAPERKMDEKRNPKQRSNFEFFAFFFSFISEVLFSLGPISSR